MNSRDGTQTFHRLPGGARVHSAQWGDGRETVVAIHGMVVAGRSMAGLAEGLARSGLEVWVPDLPGFGLSDKPSRALDVAGLADALAGWMAEAGLTGAAVIGNSFGTQVAAALAARHPSAVARLVLLSPTIDIRLRQRVPGWFEALRRAPGAVDGPIIESRWRRAVSERLIGRDLEGRPPLRHLILTEYAAAGPARAVSTYMHAIHDSIENHLSSVRAPTLVARGQNDTVVSPEWARHLAGLCEDGTYTEIPGVDHDGVYENPRRVTEKLTPFLTNS